MARTGDKANPLRIAIVGAGPTGFYAADYLFKQPDLVVEIDMFDRLPTPFGLVRCGVAPDHQKIKNVTRVFEKVAAQPGFRFFGNVEIGKHVSVEELRSYYHQIFFATGAQTDRRLNIPGEDLEGSHSATAFVAWYNGHPDFRHLEFDLSHEQVAVVGVGNVAVDVARILSRTPEELEKTDIADYALEALRESKVKIVHMLGRRGPAQAAFTVPEIKELGELEGADTVAYPEEINLDPLTQSFLERDPDKRTLQKVSILEDYAGRPVTGKPKKLVLRFLVSPVEIGGDGKVEWMRIVKNELYLKNGDIRPRSTDKFEVLPVGLVFRSVGYYGIEIPGVPFDERNGIIPNENGRIIDLERGNTIRGEYVGGWIKRGPSGVIGTNKPDAIETIGHMLQDLADGITLEPAYPSREAAERFIRERQPLFFSYDDWKTLDEIETARGQKSGRPRVKLTHIKEMLAALGRKAD